MLVKLVATLDDTQERHQPVAYFPATTSTCAWCGMAEHTILSRLKMPLVVIARVGLLVFSRLIVLIVVW